MKTNPGAALNQRIATALRVAGVAKAGEGIERFIVRGRRLNPERAREGATASDGDAYAQHDPPHRLGGETGTESMHRPRTDLREKRADRRETCNSNDPSFLSHGPIALGHTTSS